MIHRLEENVFEVNTSESYNKEIYLFGNNIIIPYINLEIFENKTPFNKIKQYDRLDFSYLIFKNVEEISWGSENGLDGFNFNQTSGGDQEYLIEYILGANILNKHGGFEFKIKYKEQYLCYSEFNANTKTGALNFWMPINTPNFMRNISEEKILEFFNQENIPVEILKFLGINNISMIKGLDFLKA
jgi:hypothetical protein